MWTEPTHPGAGGDFTHKPPLFQEAHSSVAQPAPGTSEATRGHGSLTGHTEKQGPAGNWGQCPARACCLTAALSSPHFSIKLLIRQQEVTQLARPVFSKSLVLPQNESNSVLPDSHGPRVGNHCETRGTKRASGWEMQDKKTEAYKWSSMLPGLSELFIWLN